MQIASHRITEDAFFRIPLNELGGTGMFGRAKLSTFREPQACDCSSDDSRLSAWMSLNDSAKHLRTQKPVIEEHELIMILCRLPLSRFPPRLTKSSKSFAKFHVLGG